MGTKELTDSIRCKALALGFDLVGVSPVDSFPENQFYKEWLSKGYAAGMNYMERNPGRREDVRQILPDARSVISCGLNYNTDYPYSTDEKDRTRGWIARYAWGEDYHEIIDAKLRALTEFIKEESSLEVKLRPYVDTGPVLERVYGKYGGTGWIGKNTCLINQQMGSWIFLGEIITNLELEYDNPAPDRCGTCTRCIDACPTDALREPYVLDSRLCISYLTIELKDKAPFELRHKIGNNIFGCDICQDVCPWNRKAETASGSSFLPGEGLYNPDLLALSGLGPEDFRKTFRGSPVKRAKRRGLLRNVLIAMGNSGQRSFLPSIKKLLGDEEPLVRAHAAWALWKIDGKNCRQVLLSHQASEGDPTVLEEIDFILNEA